MTFGYTIRLPSLFFNPFCQLLTGIKNGICCLDCSDSWVFSSDKESVSEGKIFFASDISLLIPTIQLLTYKDKNRKSDCKPSGPLDRLGPLCARQEEKKNQLAKYLDMEVLFERIHVLLQYRLTMLMNKI